MYKGRGAACDVDGHSLKLYSKIVKKILGHERVQSPSLLTGGGGGGSGSGGGGGSSGGGLRAVGWWWGVSLPGELRTFVSL